MIPGLAALERPGASSLATLDGLANIAGPGIRQPDVAAAVETTFASALAAVSGNAVDTMHKAEGMSLRALQGEGETREVVDAVMNAEQTLQAAIAIRDKIVSSYLEISRMAI